MAVPLSQGLEIGGFLVFEVETPDEFVLVPAPAKAEAHAALAGQIPPHFRPAWAVLGGASFARHVAHLLRRQGLGQRRKSESSRHRGSTLRTCSALLGVVTLT